MSNLNRGPSIDASYQVRFIWPCSFRGKDFLGMEQTETIISCGGHVCYRIGKKWAIFTDNLPRMLPTKFHSLGHTVSEENFF
jgi:hypothetical protein